MGKAVTTDDNKTYLINGKTISRFPLLCGEIAEYLEPLEVGNSLRINYYKENNITCRLDTNLSYFNAGKIISIQE